MLEPTWTGSKMPGKPWNGVSAPMVVLHTLEFAAFPSPTKWDSPSHFVYDPWQQDLRQYVKLDKAAYAVRDNRLEDDYLTIQVELFGKARETPGYSEWWYEGLARLVEYFNKTAGIPIVFADFSDLRYGAYAPLRMTQEESAAFSGFLGHGHMGRGTDEHWDPGNINVEKLLSFIVVEEEVPNIEETQPWQTDSWIEANNAGLINENTHPMDVLNKGDLMVFLDRLGLLVPKEVE